jgi:dienelactone hydrolase
VVHEWWGLNEHARDSARRLAKLGYAAFALDMYGKGVLAKTPDKASALAKPFLNDRPMMCARAGEGLQALRETGKADPDRIAAIGYCFGGTTVLEMARGGLDLQGVVSFHGGLSTPKPAGSISTPILVLHGAADPHVKPEDIKAFKEEMRESGADWQMVYFGGAVHSFTNPAAGDDPSRGVAYDEDAARRSWEYMKVFLKEMLKK